MSRATATRTSTMSAAVVAGPRTASVAEVEAPEPGPGEVLVRVEGCGVCASSLPVWEGRPWFEYPLPPGAPGHEAWGRLEDGTRVAFLGDRGYAEWAVAAESSLVPLPPELDRLPFPGEALGCAVNVFRRSRIEAGHRVAVVGTGFLGRAVAQLCRRSGADVVAVDRHARTDGLACERVIETGGVQETLDTAAGLVAERGVLVIAGFHQDGRRSIDLQSWNWRGIDVVNAHERAAATCLEGMSEAVRLAVDGTLDVEALVTHRYRLSELPAAFETARTRPPGFVKAWVEP